MPIVVSCGRLYKVARFPLCYLIHSYKIYSLQESTSSDLSKTIGSSTFNNFAYTDFYFAKSMLPRFAITY